MKIITLTLGFFSLICFSIKAQNIDNSILACSGDYFQIDQDHREEIDIFYVEILNVSNADNVMVKIDRLKSDSYYNNADYDWLEITTITDDYIIFENKEKNQIGSIFRYTGKIRLDKIRSQKDRSRINYLTGFCKKGEKIF